MQVGDLVKMNEVRQNLAASNGYVINLNQVGIVVEFHDVNRNISENGGWIQWCGNSDWDFEYAKDLEVISESKRFS